MKNHIYILAAILILGSISGPATAYADSFANTCTHSKSLYNKWKTIQLKEREEYLRNGQLYFADMVDEHILRATKQLAVCEQSEPQTTEEKLQVRRILAEATTTFLPKLVTNLDEQGVHDAMNSRDAVLLEFLTYLDSTLKGGR